MFALGTVSLVTDVSSEMVTAVLPLYLVTGLGLSPLGFGVLDGIYNGFSALVRLVGGHFADRGGGRHKWVAGLGYGVSAVCKPLLLVAHSLTPIGFVLAHHLPRRHDPPAKLLLYEVDVHEDHRERGVGKALMAELARIARDRGIRHGWVLTDDDNEAGMALYRSAGGRDPREVIEWEFDYTES